MWDDRLSHWSTLSMGEVSALGNAPHGEEAEATPPAAKGEPDMTDAPAVRSDASSSALSEAQVCPGPQMNVLEAARAAAELAAYVGVCPTCLAWEDPEAQAPESDRTPGRPVCPTCGRCSVEWDLAQQIDDQVEDLRGLVALDEAVRAAGDMDEATYLSGEIGATDESGLSAQADPPGGPTGTPGTGSPSQVPRRDG